MTLKLKSIISLKMSTDYKALNIPSIQNLIESISRFNKYRKNFADYNLQYWKGSSKCT